MPIAVAIVLLSVIVLPVPSVLGQNCTLSAQQPSGNLSLTLVEWKPVCTYTLPSYVTDVNTTTCQFQLYLYIGDDLAIAFESTLGLCNNESFSLDFSENKITSVIESNRSFNANIADLRTQVLVTLQVVYMYCTKLSNCTQFLYSNASRAIVPANYADDRNYWVIFTDKGFLTTQVSSYCVSGCQLIPDLGNISPSVVAKSKGPNECVSSIVGSSFAAMEFLVIVLLTLLSIYYWRKAKTGRKELAELQLSIRKQEGSKTNEYIMPHAVKHRHTAEPHHGQDDHDFSDFDDSDNISQESIYADADDYITRRREPKPPIAPKPSFLKQYTSRSTAKPNPVAVSVTNEVLPQAEVNQAICEAESDSGGTEVHAEVHLPVECDEHDNAPV